MRILAISGSLRARSSNSAVLHAASTLVPEATELIVYSSLGSLPHFNPDLDTADPPHEVNALRREIGLCQGVLISSPEYAHGIGGSLKNALDWLVSAPEFHGKPVALFNTAPRAIHAQAQMREILTTMSARFIDTASIALPLAGRTLDAAGIVSDTILSKQIKMALAFFVAEIRFSSPSSMP